MTFEQLVGRLTGLFDVTQTRAVDVANERLGMMVAQAQSLRAILSLGVTVADQARYTLPSNVVHVFKVMLTEDESFPGDNVLPPDDAVPGTDTGVYEGVVSIEDLWDISVGDMDLADDAKVFAVEPNADSDMTTESIRLRPAPSTADLGIIALVALRPAVVTYATATALPIPVDQHPALLDGAKAELFDEEGRQDEAAKHDASFQLGVQALSGAVNKRGKGSGRHRMRVSGYDLAR